MHPALAVFVAERVREHLHVAQFIGEPGENLTRGRQRFETEQARVRPSVSGKHGELAAVRADVDHGPI